ncbi:MAG: hypothetical protein B7Z06_07065, partial [Flavobacteriales bacterium 32-35-8]
VTSCDDNNFSEYNNKSIVKITGTTLDFGSTIVSSSSNVRTYTIAAQSISGNIIISTESPFSISRSFNSDFGTSLELQPSDFNKEALTIYVRFNASAEGDYTGTIIHTSPDRDNILSINLTANAVLPAPSVTINKPNLIFTGVEAGQESLPQNYTISTLNLTSSLNVSTVSPFSVATSENGTYGNSIDFQPSDLNSNIVTIYVKFSPVVVGDAQAEITHTSTGIDNIQPILLSGTTANISTLQMNDNFSYNVGDLPSQNRTTDGATNAGLTGWVKVRNANSNLPVVDDRLIYSGYLASNIGNAVTLDMDDPATNSNLYAYNMSDQQDPGEIGSYYASFMIRIDALPSAAFNRPVMFVDWLPDGATRFLGALGIEYNGGNPKFSVRYNSEIGMSSITPEVGKTYLVVLKNAVTDANVTNDNNTASVYIFDAASIPAQEPVTPTATITVALGDDGYGVKAVALLRDNDRAGVFLIDGLRVTQTWTELFTN